MRKEADRALEVVMETSSDTYVQLIIQGKAVGFITQMQFNLKAYPELRAVPIKDIDPLRLFIVTPLVTKMPEEVAVLVKAFVHRLERLEQGPGKRESL